MADQGKRTDQLPVKTSPVSTTDEIVILYGAGTANAQTALIAISNLLSNTTALPVKSANLIITDIRNNPANSTALVIQQGTMFFSTTFGYFADANNHLLRWPISSF